MLRLDPRTKLALLFTVTTLMLGASNEGAMLAVKMLLSLVPFVLILSVGRWQMASKYLLFYALCFLAERIAFSSLHGLSAFAVLALTSIMTRFAPGIMVGAYFVTTTSVSEFLTAMGRLHVSEKVLIPLAVIFRFFPTIAEEWHAIGDAMRMRGIRLGGGKVNGEAREGPLGGKAVAMLEYRLVPMMISAVKIGEELSQAALTRGLGAPVKRTNLAELGFGGWDAFFLALCVGAWLVQGWVWLH